MDANKRLEELIVFLNGRIGETFSQKDFISALRIFDEVVSSNAEVENVHRENNKIEKNEFETPLEFDESEMVMDDEVILPLDFKVTSVMHTCPQVKLMDRDWQVKLKAGEACPVCGDKRLNE